VATNEQRIAKMARKAAKLITQLEREGERDAAARLRAVAIFTANQMRLQPDQQPAQVA
jgi:hypothetical protein